MPVLDNLQPQEVLYYFEEICNIPHGSRNTKLISDYIAKFAEIHHLEYVQDEYNNVIIYKASNNGSNDTIILQGHMDMVCEKEEDCDIDFDYEPLRLMVDGDMIKAEGTTLGGDDGVAVAMMLAILDSKDIKHPNLECLFTVDEEIGMLGATGLDKSLLKGRKLLNIDSEEEGHLLVSCAGGATVTIHIPILRRGARGQRYHIEVSGLVGGHSGIEIDKGRANADILLGKILQAILMEDDSVRLISLKGGLKDNAIPVKSQAEIIAMNGDAVKNALDEFMKLEMEKYVDTDPDINVTIRESEDKSLYPLDEGQNVAFIMAYANMPYGVIAYSKDIEGLVETSLNFGIMNTYENEIVISYSVRSSVNSDKQALIDQLTMISKSLGGYVEIEGDYPAWEYVKDSTVRDIMVSTYKEMYNKDMIVEAVHAGLECGIFSDALKGLDAVSFGPDIFDIHTPKERLSISSLARTWDYVKNVISRF
ncbi:MAG: aminoacyl-histidine dipeptidase [Eubacterium sp.]|nr:aminoacyl-histidine dipeptidase [Eubacterium sp.]